MNSLAPDTGLLSFRSGAMRFDRQRVGAPSEALFDPDNPRLGAAPVKVGGRQSAWFVSGDFGSAVLRHYRRGGMVARISRDRYVWTGASSTRAFAEFEVLAFLHRRGIAVPAPLAAAYWRAGIFYRAAILIQRIPNVLTLAEALDAPVAVAQTIHAMHDAGVWHADLNAYNILLDKAGKAWLIDFDRARRRNMDDSARQENLMRLRRSLQKVAGSNGLDCWEKIRQAYEQIRAEAG